MGHIGLTPQSVHRMGGHKVQGQQRGQHAGRARAPASKTPLAVEEAGAFAIVLEGIPLDLAAEITERASIPTIGIGAGVHCDGQILVLHDVLGLCDTFAPKFAKRYVELWRRSSRRAVRHTSRRCASGAFPTEAHSLPLAEQSSGRWTKAADRKADARAMHVTTAARCSASADAERRGAERIGFVPTMG